MTEYSMKQYIVLLILLFISCNTFSQGSTQIEGVYTSKKKYGDIWTLTLNSDSSFTFKSKMGESIVPGKWSVRNNSMILSNDYMGENYEYVFVIRLKESKLSLKGRTKPFKRMRLTH